MHSFHAYIDEAGDDGFSFKPWPDRGSSEWFVVSAVVVRSSRHSEASQAVRAVIDPVETARGAPIHFTKLSHDQRIGVVHGLSRVNMRAICVCFNKQALPDGHTLEGNRRLYFYAVRYLLERVSWLSREYAPLEQGGDGRCKLHFSKCKGLSYSKMFAYLEKLKGDQTEVAWRHLDTEKCAIATHDESSWLRVTDCVASGFAKALELTQQGFCEDRYARLLKPVMYHAGRGMRKRYMGYGLKIAPSTPQVQPERDNRYGWLSLYRNV